MSKSPIEELRERAFEAKRPSQNVFLPTQYVKVVPLSTAEEIVGKLHDTLLIVRAQQKDDYDRADSAERKLEQAGEALSIAKRDIISITNAARERILDLGGSCDLAQKTWMQPVERIEQALAALTPEEKQDANVG